MALVHRFAERVADAGAGADHRRLLDAKLNFNTMFMELIDRIGGIAFWFFAWHYGCGR